MRGGRPRAAAETWDLGRVPLLALSAGAGLLVCAAANLLSRETTTFPVGLYWLGLLIVAVPIFLRLTSAEPSYRERLGLVALFGLAMFAVKVIHDSPMFVFPDELVHAFNADQIANHHHLFRFDPILPVTPRYPGLEAAASSLMSMTGISSFAAGTLVVGAARLMFTVALFLLFARVSGSPRLAGIGVAVYTGSSNFLFWSAQFSYESLSLPLLVVALLAFVEWDSAEAGWRRAWAIPIFLIIAGIVVTHHLTAYATIVVFAVLALLHRLLKVERPNPWPFAAVSLGLVAVWLLVVANSTVGYLFPVLEKAVRATFNTAAGEAPPRELFKSSASGNVGETPFLPRIVALLAVALLGLGMLYGLRAVWRRHRRQPLAVMLALGAIGFFGALTLRLAPAAWETGNRAAEFFFIGLAFVVAQGAVELLGPNGRRRGRRLAIAAALAVILAGGAISGWPWDAQLAKPLRAEAEGREIASEPLALARWAQRELPGARFAGPEADARMLMAPGEAVAFAGQGPDVKDIVTTPQLEDWQLPVLRQNGLRYVVADRRDVSGDNTRGYFFSVPGEGNNDLLGLGVVHKFSRIPVARVFDAGNIVVFDVENGP